VDKILVVFPNDPLYKYFNKGEIKKRYWNPCNYFDTIHVISLSKEDISGDKVQKFFGNAKVFVHSVGKPKIYNYFFYRKKIIRMLKNINPDIIRAHNPQIHGYLATYAGKKLSIPVLISLHGNYDKDIREILLNDKKYVDYIKNKFLEIFAEKFVLTNASMIICAYEFPISYATKHGAKDVEVIYNRVYKSDYREKTDYGLNGPLKILCVGRLIKEKGQERLIKAIKGIDATLTLIGDGYLFDYLKNLSIEYGVEKKVNFIRSVPNKDISKYYFDSDVFSIPIEYGGIAIPVIEAIATGLPIVVPKPKWEDSPEIVGDFALVVENNENDFREAFSRLIESEELRKQIGMKGRERFLEITGEKMEQKEFLIYKKLVERKPND